MKYLMILIFIILFNTTAFALTTLRVGKTISMIKSLNFDSNGRVIIAIENKNRPYIYLAQGMFHAIDVMEVIESLKKVSCILKKGSENICQKLTP